MSRIIGFGRAIRPHDVLSYLRPFFLRSGCQLPHDERGPSPRAGNYVPPRTINIALCVSGGPDSMALAYLLKNIPPVEGTNIDTTALIVDHGARKESSDEARVVQENLNALGIASHVLRMQWPVGTKPLELSNFESQAREKRYRLIARAALDRNIRHIFLGHHQDDQVENILIRFIRGQKTVLGLTGMPLTTSVPCCDDIFGVNEALESRDTSRLSDTINYGNIGLPSPFGINMYRPLLDFPKADLVATCKEFGVQYVTDSTNFDPKRSVRHAIRYARTEYRLPKALKPQRIIALQRHAENEYIKVIELGSKMLLKFQLETFDLRSGKMVITFPTIADLLREPAANDIVTHRALSYAVSKVIELVTPSPRTDQPLLAEDSVVRKLIPGLNQVSDEQTFVSGQDDSEKIFNYRRVSFVHHPSKPYTWILSRQPMHIKDQQRATHGFKHLEIESNHESCLSHLKKSETQMKLWDNRYWIRLSTSDADIVPDLTLSPFRKKDISAIEESLRKNDRSKAKTEMEKFRSLLHKAAPGKIRYTLPILKYQDQIIGLPTLDYRINDPQTNNDGIRTLRWHVRYKTVHGIEALLTKSP